MGLSSCTKYGVVRFRAALLGHLSVSSLERCLRSFALDFAAFPLNNGLVVWWLEHSAVTTGSSQEGVTIPPFPIPPFATASIYHAVFERRAFDPRRV